MTKNDFKKEVLNGIKTVEFRLKVLERFFSLIPHFIWSVGILILAFNFIISYQFNKKIGPFESYRVTRTIHLVDKQFKKINNKKDQQDVKPEDLSHVVILFNELPKNYQSVNSKDKINAIREYYMKLQGGEL